ncbi:MAG: GTPase HflX [Clostridia bacterium]|nr:GTPase HflX [Clostridia bacterium]
MTAAHLIVVHLPGRASWAPEDEARELAALVSAAGVEVAGTSLQRRARPDPATVVGAGKLAEVRAAMDENGAELAVVSRELSPAQARNLEEALGRPVLDRTQVVLDIFAQRARTREGRLQVELAQARYLLPRLAGVGRLLSRLGGGIGTRGPGETKLEVDRRRLRERIRQLEAEIAEIRRRRRRSREGRRRLGLPVVALVGYTNAGKSTLFNRLTGARVHVEDALFATLDPTLRRAELGRGRQVLLSDTVGFVHDLPHHLVAAFRATLEEVAEADVLLHVLDVSRPGWELRLRAVEAVLDEIGADRQPRVLAQNQWDRLAAAGAEPPLGLPDGVPVSAATGFGLDALKEALVAAIARVRATRTWRIPYREADLVAWLRGRAEIVEERYEPEGVFVAAICDDEVAALVSRRLAARPRNEGAPPGHATPEEAVSDEAAGDGGRSDPDGEKGRGSGGL